MDCGIDPDWQWDRCVTWMEEAANALAAATPPGMALHRNHVVPGRVRNGRANRSGRVL